MIRVMLTATALAVSGLALAKLPPVVLDDAAKAKAAEAAAKAAWQGKLDTYQLCKAQDRVAAQYKKTAVAKPAAAMPALAAASAAPATASNSGNPTTTAQGGGTPVATVAAAAPDTSLPACMDPGPFAYAPPEQKPLETSGAHSPAATAASPPSVKPNSAEMAPAKPSTASAAPAPARKP